MSRLEGNISNSSKEIQIQPKVKQNIQPIITREIQPIILQKIQPVVHQEIQPIINQEIQPIITTEIQPIINEKIQPVIFSENQKNIEEVIQQLEQSHQSDEKNIFELFVKPEKEESIMVEPRTERTVQNSEKVIIQPYIMKTEKHVTQPIVKPTTTKTVVNIEKIKYVPYIKYKDGKILPYETNEVKLYQSDKTNSSLMKTILAVNFISIEDNINYPMPCKTTDVFSKIENRLYHIFPVLKTKKIYFIANGNVIDRKLTFEQNKIKNGNTILINELNK